MTPPRQVLPGKTVIITSRAVGRSFRFVPKKRVVESIWYCVAVVAANAEYRVRIHEVVYMSNHVHIVATFDDDSMPDFMQDLNSLVSRQLNALRGRTGTNFEPHFNAVEIADVDKILDHCAYALANPCSAHLVTRAVGWRGVTSARLEYGQSITIERPQCGMWKPNRLKEKKRQQGQKAGKLLRHRKSAGRAKYAGRSKLPEQVEFSLERPPGFGELNDTQLREEVRRRTEILEDKAEAERAKRGWKALGMRRVIEQHWADFPDKTEPRFGTVPKASGSSKWARMEVLQRCARFQQAYAKARDAYVAGDHGVQFPCGTWLMKRRFKVRCGASPP